MFDQHYLRGEDGIDHADYEDVLPASFIRHGQLEHSHSASRRGSVPPSMHNGFDNSSLTAQEAETDRADHGDATKRVRVKRSNPTLRERTPLLSQSGAHAINFGDDDMSTPLPMMLVAQVSIHVQALIVCPSVSRMKSLEQSSSSNGMAYWKQWDPLVPILSILCEYSQTRCSIVLICLQGARVDRQSIKYGTHR